MGRNFAAGASAETTVAFTVEIFRQVRARTHTHDRFTTTVQVYPGLPLEGLRGNLLKLLERYFHCRLDAWPTVSKQCR